MRGLATKGDIKVVVDRIQTVETKVDGLAENIDAVMTHLGITAKKPATGRTVARAVTPPPVS